MITASGLTKRYGATTAVDDLSFTVTPGVVTGFLGPNGAGKTTSMRLMLGLDTASAGTVTVNGHAYRATRAPIQEIGALLDPTALHPGRSAYHHLLWQAQAGGVPRRRVDEVLELVGLAAVAGTPAGTFSLGMSQRLGIASALLGDPPVLVFDEPVNGLDPEGIQWIRGLMRRFADEGRTVFLSSHLMSEMEQTADQVLVIGRGRLVADLTMEEMIRRSAHSHVRLVAVGAGAMVGPLERAGAVVRREGAAALMITGLDTAAVGAIAHGAGIALDELSVQRASLEAAYMELTADSVQYRAAAPPASRGVPALQPAQ
jgi:ABC-2 type transport system ATP-binding protein